MSEQEASKVAEEKKPEEKKAEEKPKEVEKPQDGKTEKPKAEKKEKPKKKKAGADEEDDDQPERPKRDRKRAEQFQTDGAPDGGSRSVEEYEGGSGSKLGDIPNVNVMLTKEKDAAMIQTLHRLCYKTVGKKTTQKKRLREFSGLAKETKEATRDRVSRMPVQKLRSVAKIFDCNPEGSEKDDHIDAITKFLINPKSSGKPLKVERTKATKRKASSKKSDKKVSKKSKKDPNAPKKGLSAYFFFTNEQRENVKKKHPTYSMTDIAKKLGAKWSALSETEKKPYQKMAAKDKLRYDKEKAAYEKKGGSKKAKTEKGKKKKEESESESESESSKDDSDQEESSEEEAEDTKKGKRQREEKDGDEEETPSKKQKDE